jgi:hypothetical protein
MEKSNVKQRVINIQVLEGDETLFEKKNALPQDIMAALSLFERDGLKVVVSIDTIDISTGSSEHNIK